MSSCPPSHSSFCTRWNLRVNPNHHPAAPQTISASDPPQLGPWLGKVTSSAGLVRGQDPPFPAMQVPLTPLKSQDSTIFMIFLPPPHVCACSVTSVLSNSLWPYGLLPTRLLCSQDSSGKNTWVGCHALLQGIFPTQGLNPHLSWLFHWQVGSLALAPLAKTPFTSSHNFLPPTPQETKLHLYLHHAHD